MSHQCLTTYRIFIEHVVVGRGFMLDAEESMEDLFFGRPAIPGKVMENWKISGWVAGIGRQNDGKHQVY
jgi:hypothetical protein